MKSPVHIVLVLWGEGFDEIAASLFVAGLRRQGKRVQLVGLNRQQIAGQHGLMLVPDLPLGQALGVANTVHCIIIPAPLAALQQFSYDPRLAELMGLASHHQALIVAAAPYSPRTVTYRPSSFLATLDPLIYPATDELLSFIRDLLVPRLNGKAAPHKEPPHDFNGQLNGQALQLNGKH